MTGVVVVLLVVGLLTRLLELDEGRDWGMLLFVLVLRTVEVLVLRLVEVEDGLLTERGGAALLLEEGLDDEGLDDEGRLDPWFDRLWACTARWDKRNPTIKLINKNLTVRMMKTSN